MRSHQKEALHQFFLFLMEVKQQIDKSYYFSDKESIFAPPKNDSVKRIIFHLSEAQTNSNDFDIVYKNLIKIIDIIDFESKKKIDQNAADSIFYNITIKLIDHYKIYELIKKFQIIEIKKYQ